MGEYDISQWRLAGTQIHTPSDPKMATGVRTGFTRRCRWAALRAAALRCELRAASCCAAFLGVKVAPSGTRGMGNPAAVKRF